MIGITFLISFAPKSIPPTVIASFSWSSWQHLWTETIIKSHSFHSSKTATHQFQHLTRPWLEGDPENQFVKYFKTFTAWILFLKSKTPCKYGLKKTPFSRSNVEFARLWDWNTSSTEVENKTCEIFRIYGPKQLLKTDIHQDQKKQCSSAPDPNTCSSTPICIIHHLAAWNQKQGLTICTFFHSQYDMSTHVHANIHTHVRKHSNKLHINILLNFSRYMCKNMYMYIGIYM